MELIIKALQNYESIPNRRNMITDSMMWWLHKKARTSAKDSDTSAMVDWFILGRYTGFRKSEWCQSRQTVFERVTHWPEQPALATIESDFEFLDINERILDSTKELTQRKSNLFGFNGGTKKIKNMEKKYLSQEIGKNQSSAQC